MANYNGKYFKGPVGPMIFKQGKKGQIITSRPSPGTVKQTEETKKASDTFGMASILSVEVKNSFERELMNFQDKTMYIRLVKQVSEVMYRCRNPETRRYHFDHDSFHGLAGFDFNINSPAVKWLGTMPHVNYTNGMLGLLFPDDQKSKKLKFVKGSSYCDMTVAVTVISLADGLRSRYPLLQEQRFDKETNPELNGKRFDFKVPDGCLCVVSIFLKFYNFKNLQNTKTFSPAFICDAIITDGIDIPMKDPNWMDLRVKFL